MTIKKSVSLSDACVDILKKRKQVQPKSAPTFFLSTAINDIVSNYDILIKDCLPKLSLTEWEMLVEVYSKKSASLKSLNIASDLLVNSGSLDINEIKSSKPLLHKLIEKASNFTKAQQVAVLDRVQCYISKD